MGILGETQAPPTQSNTGGDIVSGLTGGLLNHAVSAMFAGSEDNRQYNQAERLQGLQIQGAQQMANISQHEQEGLWDYTNYENQVKHAEAANLNPALLYGLGGGGGVTAGAGNVPTPSGQKAATGAENQEAATGMAMMLSQQKLMNAQANLANAQADKTRGVDTDNTSQNTATAKSQQQLNEANTANTNLRTEITNHTKEYTYQDLAGQADQSMAKARQEMTKANIAEDTQLTTIHQIQADYITTLITQAYTKSNIAVNNEKIKNMANEIVNRNKQTEINQGNLDINRAQQQTNELDVEQQHADRYKNLQQQLENYQNIKELGDKEILTQGIGTILGIGTRGSNTKQGIGYKTW